MANITGRWRGGPVMVVRYKGIGRRPPPATLRHLKSLLPLLPSGPGGVHRYSLRRDRRGPPLRAAIISGRQSLCNRSRCGPLGWSGSMNTFKISA